MNRSSIDNILKGVFCACVVASGCGMKPQEKKETKETDEIRILKEALVNKDIIEGNSENKKCNDEDVNGIINAILPVIRTMYLKH